ncbi:hypothetical protein PYCCODRAFT_130541 [Trametes coccinea BRFM310]|uniref:Uncharacterized protein n=1 Tax=Trametes coccinea (strain BRFM310) TaxID=1353009 RepID=A0A1Y2ISY0_TRAC3|nr:hypothetical protein PYCCODRAFT_130541 [Trametes coccinea BRFM310]
MVLILWGLVPLLTLLCFLRSALSQCVFIDDTDPQIQYQGKWVFVSSSGMKDDYQGTLVHSTDPQTSATIRFTGTEGSSIAVYGALEPTGDWSIVSAYTLDSVPMGVYQPDKVVLDEEHRVLFFASGPLGAGNHTLVIENLGDQFWLDYIGLGGPDDNPANPCPDPSLDNLPGSGGSSSSSPLLPPSSSSTTSSAQVTSTTDQNPQSCKPFSSNTASVNSTSPQPSEISDCSSTISAASHSTTIVSESIIPLTQSHAPTSVPLTTFPSLTSAPVAHNATVNAVPGAEQPVSTVLYTGAIAGIVVAGIVVLLAVVATAVVLRRRCKRARARSLITPFDANATVASNRPLTPPPMQPAKLSLSAADSPVSHRVDLLEPSELNLEAQPERASAPPATRGRVLNIRRGGTGTWADYRSSAPTSRGPTRASTMLSMSGAGTGRGAREREARFTWSTGKAVFGSSDDGAHAERVPRRRG